MVLSPSFTVSRPSALVKAAPARQRHVARARTNSRETPGEGKPAPSPLLVGITASLAAVSLAASSAAIAQQVEEKSYQEELQALIEARSGKSPISIQDVVQDKAPAQKEERKPVVVDTKPAPPPEQPKAPKLESKLAAAAQPASSASEGGGVDSSVLVGGGALVAAAAGAAVYSSKDKGGGQAASASSGAVAENVAEARAWIAAWRAKQPGA